MIMSILLKLKNILKKNKVLKAFYHMYLYYRGCDSSDFGYIADDVTITPPLIIFLILKMYF